MNLTVVFIIALVLVVTIYDVWIIKKAGKYESISAHIIRMSKESRMLPLAVGVLIGHLWWSMDSFDYLPKEEIIKRCHEYTTKVQ